MASIARRKALALRGPATPMEYPSSARYIAHRLPMNGFGRRITHYQWRSKEFTDLTRQNTDKYEVMLGMKLYDHEWNTHRVHSCRVYKKNVITQPQDMDRGNAFRWQLLPAADDCKKAVVEIERTWGAYYHRHVDTPRKWHHPSLDTVEGDTRSKWKSVGM
ncbi:uncharacterized protein LOC135815069 [Sycon ciliatum]|uniref:uncharacterized protein LOC135815069 n=1 Tax=Sycon ciliatum TaxID=27933 RepID=UPI0031F6C544